MIGLLLVLAVIAAMFALAIRREALWTWAVLLAVVTLFIKLGLFAGTLHVPSFTAWALSAGCPPSSSASCHGARRGAWW